jgi:hypothetical protein
MTAMSHPNATLDPDAGHDDLPRTFRRAREEQEREREAREREQKAMVAEAPPGYAADFDADGLAQPAVVTAVRMPFLGLVKFFLKAVVAAIPALILLLAILWGIGEILMKFFPSLVKMQILIRFPH